MPREQLYEQYGPDCRVQALRKGQRFGGELFVVDFTVKARLLRVLGSFGPRGRLTEQSALDLLHPERLVYPYERLMLGAFAVVPQPRSVLLLGLGGGAMIRHLDAYFPEIEVTVVENDRVVIDLARRYFRIDREILEADARDVVARRSARWDVVMVDLYDGSGSPVLAESFWQDCAASLAPGGCISINWAEFVGFEDTAAKAALAEAAAGTSFFLVEQGDAPNVIQLAPTDPGFRLAEYGKAWRRLAQAHRLPREVAGVLRKTEIARDLPRHVAD
jgi:hypothetical protein